MVVILGIALTMFACSDAAGYGSIGVGWTLDGVNFVGGLLRMLFPFLWVCCCRVVLNR